ncbi:MAG: ACT domain-containing protein [Bacillota bacterium]
MGVPERTLSLLAGATWHVWPCEMAIASFPREARSRVVAMLAGESLPGPVWWGDDGFELTVLAPREVFESGHGLAGISGGRVEAGWALVTCRTPLPWDVVGFLAEVTARLARAGMTCGAFSAFSRDHLLVPWSKKDEVRQVLGNGGAGE